MLPSTTRSYPSSSIRKAVFALGSSVSPFLLPSYSTWSPSSPSPPSSSASSSSHRPRRHQRRSIAITVDPPYEPPPSGSLSELIGSLRGRSKPTAGLEVTELSRAKGRELEDDFATSSGRRPPRPPKLSHARRYSPELREIVVDGIKWNQKTIVEAYAVALPESSSRAGRALSRQWTTLGEMAGFTGNLVDSLTSMAGVAAGGRLRDVLYKLDIDDSLFLSWRDALLTADVRDALVALQRQTSPASMSADGDPLWPPWLVETVIARSATSIDAHLSVSLMAHHLPHLPQTYQEDIVLKVLDKVVEFELIAAVPEMVHLVLSGDVVQSPPSFVGKDAMSARSAYLSAFLQTLAAFPSSGRSIRARAHPVVAEQIRRVLAHMSDHSISLAPESVVPLAQARFLADDALKSLLVQLVHDAGLHLGQPEVESLLITAVAQDQPEVASQCMDLLDGLKAQASTRPRSRTGVGSRLPRPDGRSKEARDESNELVYEALVISDEDAASGQRHEFFDKSTVHFLSGLKDPPTALAYIQTLRIPPRSSSAHARTLPWVSAAFAVLAKTLASATETASVDDLLRALQQSALFFGNDGNKVIAVQHIMKGLLLRNEIERVFDLWQQIVIDEKIPPSVGMLEMYGWACDGYGTFSAGLKMMDQWSVRHGVHTIQDPSTTTALPKGTPPLDRSHRLVVTSASRSAKPVVRVQLDASILVRNTATLIAHNRDRGCGLEIAFRLWDAAEPRWGITQSVEMLDVLLKGAARVQPSLLGPRTREMRQWETRKADERLVEMGDPSVDEVDADGAVDWARASVDRFFALPPDPIADEDGPKQQPEDLEMWMRAKNLFEDILTANWPFLSSIPHPFDDLASPSGGLPPTLHLPTHPISPTSPSPYRNPTPYLPPPSLYSHLHPTSTTFHHYIRLLLTQHFHHPHLELIHQIPFAFAFMRHLGIYPQYRTILIALAHLELHDPYGPARLARLQQSRGAGGSGSEGEGGLRKDGKRNLRGARDAEMMRWWLEEWLGGEEGLPTREEVEEEWAGWERRRRRVEGGRRRGS